LTFLKSLLLQLLTADCAAKFRILEIVFLNRRLDDAIPEVPVDVVAEGLISKNTRDNRTAVELFLAGVQDLRTLGAAVALTAPGDSTRDRRIRKRILQKRPDARHRNGCLGYSPSMSAKRTGNYLCLILAIHVALLAWGAYSHSPTIDEIAYLPAGLSHWQLGNFELAKVSPPLVPSIAAIPLLAFGAETNWSHLDPTPGSLISHSVGRDFLIANGPRSLWLFMWARWALIPLSVLGAVSCYLWARDLAGRVAGLMSAALWCFCPNILAHAQLVTTDLGATALGIAAGYTFWRWLKRPTWGSAVLAGLALGGAESAKTTLLAFVGLWPMLWLAWTWSVRRSTSRAIWRQTAGQLALIMITAWYCLNSVYGFDGSFKPLGQFPFVSRTFAGSQLEPGAIGNRFTHSWLGAIPMPLPEQYVLGVDLQRRELENIGPRGLVRSYLRGRWSNHGWWYYYLYGLAVKIPLGTWWLLLIAVWLRGGTPKAIADWRNDITVLAPIATILAIVSSQTEFSAHFRYILPILPFGFVWISQSIRAVIRRSTVRNLAVAIALSWSIASSLWCAPHHLAYFNELTGGPFGGHFHLLDSNIDWGQDLLYLKTWIAAHPSSRPMKVAYLGLFPPNLIGIDYPPPPESAASDADSAELRPGWYAISVGFVRGDDYGGERNLEYFLRLKPTGYAGYSIYLYQVTSAQASQLGCLP
jgi:hypothetical protein